MADENQTDAQSAPQETPSGPETQTATAVADRPSPAASQEDTGGKGDSDDIWKRLSELDPDELVRRDRRLASRIGNLAQRRVDQEVNRRLEAYHADLEARRLQDLAEKDDLYTLGQEKKREIQEGAARSQEFDRYYRFWREHADPLLLAAIEDLPVEGQRAIRRKYESGEYGEDPRQARLAFLQDVKNSAADVKVRAAVKEARTKWEREELPARIKSALSDSAEGEPSPVTGGGSPPPKGSMSQEEFDQHRHDRSWLGDENNWKRFQAGRRAGLITR